MSNKDLVKEARELAAAINSHTLGQQEKLRDLLSALVDEVERLREIEERYNEAVSSGLILDEDHHAKH